MPDEDRDSVCESHVEYDKEGGIEYSGSERGITNSSGERTTYESGSEISDAVIDISGEIVRPRKSENTTQEEEITIVESEGEETETSQQ